MKTKNNRILTYYKIVNFVTISMCIMFFISSNNIMAQKNWGLTFRTGANLPTKDLGNAKLKTGFGFEGTIDYKIIENLAVYAGWGWNKFVADNSFAGSNFVLEETGYRYGLQYAAPIGTSKLKYLIGAGGLYNHIEIENSNGDIIADSGHGFGWEVDAGVQIPISDDFTFIPTVRYHSLSREIKIGTIATDVDLNYFSIGAGLKWTF